MKQTNEQLNQLRSLLHKLTAVTGSRLYRSTILVNGGSYRVSSLLQIQKIFAFGWHRLPVSNVATVLNVHFHHDPETSSCHNDVQPETNQVREFYGVVPLVKAFVLTFFFFYLGCYFRSLSLSLM